MTEDEVIGWHHRLDGHGYGWTLGFGDGQGGLACCGSLDFLELRQVLSTYDGNLRDPLWWPHERPVPMRVAREPLGISLPPMPGPKTLCGLGAGT